jgi:AcrR family transcriptional regulator
MNIDASLPPRTGEATRDALVSAAIDVFARNGYNGASTRAIAEAAGVNQALIGYHFRGKSGLYLAVFEHIATLIERRVGPIVTAIEAELATDLASAATAATSARCLDALRRLTNGFAALLTSDESAAWASLILREQQNPSEGFDLLYERFMSRVLGVIRALVGHIRGTDPDAVETRLTALTIAGQVLVFRAARAAVMRQMAWQTIGPDELERIQQTIHLNLDAILAQGPRR